MKLKNVIKKLANTRNLVHLRCLKNRNLRIVLGQSSDFRYSDVEVVYPDTDTIFRLAQECYLHRGYYPISFSWPRIFEEPRDEVSSAISATVPYVPYSFLDADEYYKSYACSILGITQRKGGWDCFRHLEIISAGCIPLFLGAAKIPKFTMIHYPKDLFRSVNRDYIKRSLVPDKGAAKRLVDFANENLTSRAMCRYFSELSNFSITLQDTILFVDSKLSSAPDYLSVLNFIGLKQVYGDQVECLFDEPDYVYVDSSQNISELYGRGFGYSKVLERGRVRLKSTIPPKVILISNLERDSLLLPDLKTKYPTSDFVMFWGADKPISKDVMEETLRLTKGILFCREIY